MKTFLHKDLHQEIHLLPQGHTKKSLSKAYHTLDPLFWNSLPSGLKSIDKTDTFHSNFIKWMKNF